MGKPSRKERSQEGGAGAAGYPDDWEATAEQHLERLRAAVRKALDGVRLSKPDLSDRTLSRRLGRHYNHVGKMLRGEGKLIVREICELLEKAGAVPSELFLSVYPPGGTAELALRERVPRPQDATLPFAQLDAALRRLAPAYAPAEVADRFREGLQRRIRNSPRTQKELSLALGMRSARALGQALWGSTALTFDHTFRVLAALGEEPAAFFFEVFDPQEGEVMPGVPLGPLLDHVDRLHRKAVATLSAELEEGVNGRQEKELPGRRSAGAPTYGRDE